MLIIQVINTRVLAHFDLCLNKEIHHHLLPHISYARIPSTLGTVWLPWQLHPAVKEGRRKRAQAAVHRSSAEMGRDHRRCVVSAENYRRAISACNIYTTAVKRVLRLTLSGTNICIKWSTTGEMHQKFSLITLDVHAREHAHAHGATGRPWTYIWGCCERALVKINVRSDIIRGRNSHYG